jgi:hypothetical protein
MAIDKFKYPFSAKLVEILGMQNDFANPCQIELGVDIPLARKRLETPSLEMDWGKPFYMLRLGSDAQGVDSLTGIFKANASQKPAGKTQQQLDAALNAAKIAIDRAAKVIPVENYDIFEKMFADEVTNECREHQRNTEVWEAVDANYVIQFTDPLLVQRGATIESVAPAIREQIRPVFLNFENSQRHLTALEQRANYLKDDIATYSKWISEIEELTNFNSSDKLSLAIRNYGSSCTPILARRNGLLEQGSMDAYPRWGGNRNWNQGWHCILHKGMPKYTATHPEEVADPLGQAQFRGDQINALNLRLDAFKSEKRKFESKLKNVLEVEIPKQKQIVAEKTALWNAQQKVIVDFLNGIADAAKQEAEAQNLPQIIEAQREATRLAEQTKQKLAEIAAREAREKRTQSLLIVGGVSAVGVAYFSTRGAGGGSRIGNLAIGGLMLAGLGYGIYTYMKAPEIVTEEPTAQQSSTLTWSAKQRRNFKLRKWAMGQVETKVGVNQQCGGRMTLEQQRECEAQFTAFSGFMGMPLGSTGNS